jgi:ADP-ribose pyrophosphatase YjhB (NUDIX family)
MGVPLSDHGASMQRRAFSVSIFAHHAGRILLIHHKRLGTWLPVGGELHEGETPLEAAQRELFEETGLKGRFTAQLGVDGTPPGLIGYEEHMAGTKGLHMNFAFVADVDTDTITPNDEFTDFRWVRDPDELPCPANVRQLALLALRCRGAD